MSQPKGHKFCHRKISSFSKKVFVHWGTRMSRSRDPEERCLVHERHRRDHEVVSGNDDELSVLEIHAAEVELLVQAGRGLQQHCVGFRQR